MSEKKQYFYLVGISTDKAPGTYIVPNKITLQEYEAVKYGRRLAAELRNDSLNSKVYLYRQPITRNGEIEKLCDLKPFNSGEPQEVNASNTRSYRGLHKKRNRYFLIHWSNSITPTLASGKDELDALKSLGCEDNASLVDRVEPLPEKMILRSPGYRVFLTIKQVGGLIQPHKVLNCNKWCTGISFMDGTSAREYYNTEELARKDYEFLKDKLFKNK